MTNDAQTGKRPPLHKRQYIVDKPFQYRLIGLLMVVWLANSLFFSTVLYFFYEGHLREFYDLVPRPGMLPLLSLPALFAVAIAFIAVFGVVVLGVVGLYMSNQIAGPLYRTKKCLDRVARGDWNFSVQFRQGDFLNDFAVVFNAMLAGLRQLAEAEVEELRSIEGANLDLSQLKRGMRKLREKKEAQLNQPPVEVTEETEHFSLAPH